MDAPTRSVPLDRLLERRDRVRSAARALVRDENAADDLEQDLWVEALERPPRSDRSLGGWLAAALRHNLVDRIRSEGSRRARERRGARAERVPSAAEAAAEAEARRRVAEAVLGLPEPHRSALLLRYFAALTDAEAAARLGVPVETLRTRVKRARAALRDRLAARSGGGAGGLLALLVGRRAEAVPALGGVLMAKKAGAAIAALLALLLLCGVGWLVAGPSSAPDGGAPGAPPAGGTAGLPATGPTAAGGAEAASAGADAPRRRGPSGADAAAGEPAPETDRDAAAEAGAPAPPLPKSVDGRVVDASTGEGIRGARVLLAAVARDGSSPGWWGERTGAEGGFRFVRDGGMMRYAEDGKHRFELRVRAAGYRDWAGPVEGERPEIRLVAQSSAPVPGTVRGVATGADGTAFEGLVLVEGFDGLFHDRALQWAWADSRGDFELPGVPAGPWRMRAGGGEFHAVFVAEGGEVFLSLAVGPGGGSRAGSTGHLRGREVRVVGLPADAPAGSFLRAETGIGGFFRTRVDGGGARFAGLPVGPCAFVLERPGLPEAHSSAEVVEGEGTQEVRLR